MRKLAIPAALALGEACGFAAFSFGPAWVLALLLSVAVAIFGHGFGVRFWRMAAVFFLGLALALRSSEMRQDALRAAASSGIPFEHAFTVESEPVVRGGETNTWVSFESAFSGVDVRVVFRLEEGMPLPELGETWRCAGWLERKDPGDYRRRFLWVKGRGTFAARDGPAGRSRLRAALATARHDLSRRLGIGLEESPEIADLNRAILLGERTRLSSETRNLFAEAGTLHIFAVSGLHVIIVAKLALVVFALLCVPYRFAGLAVVPLLWLYVEMVGASPSAVRAAAMASAYFIAPILWRRHDGLSAWAVTFVLFHLVAPENIVKVSSILSFAVMLGILAFVEFSRDLWPKWVEAIGVSFSAWAAGAPIAAHVFGEVAPGGFLANLVLVPAAGISLCAGAFGVSLSYISTDVAAHFNNVAALFTEAMVGISWVVSRLPLFHFKTDAWTLWDCAAWYAVLCLFAWLVRSVALRRRSVV